MDDIPTDAEGFDRWRKKQSFATAELARTAFLVERDMRNIKIMGDGATPTIRRMAKAYRAHFAAMLAAS